MWNAPLLGTMGLDPLMVNTCSDGSGSLNKCSNGSGFNNDGCEAGSKKMGEEEDEIW